MSSLSSLQAIHRFSLRPGHPLSGEYDCCGKHIADKENEVS